MRMPSVSELVSPANAFYWEDNCWVNPPFSDYRIVELDVYTFTTEGTLAAATQQIDRITRQGINAIVINPDSLFTVASARRLCAPTSPVIDERQQLRHFIDVCHYEGIAVCIDLPLPAAFNSLAERADSFLSSPQQAFLEEALRWLCDFHADALRLTGTQLQHSDPFPRQLRQRANDLTSQTGRQYYLLVDCEASPVMLQGQDRQQFLCQIDQPQSTASLPRVAGIRQQRAYRHEFIYERRFARALHDLLDQAA